MVDGMAGKGDRPRPVNRKAWERNYVLAFCKDCKNCFGTGKVTVVHLHPAKFNAAGPRNWASHSTEDCPFCEGVGKVDRYDRRQN